MREFSYDFSCCSNPLPILYVPHFPKNSILIPIWKLNETQQILRVNTYPFFLLFLSHHSQILEKRLNPSNPSWSMCYEGWLKFWKSLESPQYIQGDLQFAIGVRVEKRFTKSVASRSLESLRIYILLGLKGFVFITYCNYLL